jgi:hypothetical protein
MDLQVIGAGFGRTGTMSLKAALEQLGFDPCYHMIETWGRAGHDRMWQDALDGRPVDWDALFDGFRATVDWPACTFWDLLLERNPGAKVLLSRRDPEAWYRSITSTIIPAISDLPPPDDPGYGHRRMTQSLLFDRTFGHDLSKENLLATLAAHEADVIARCPADKLLVFDVAEGWEPLCAFLEVPVPDGEFPRSNSTEEFNARVEAGKTAREQGDASP